MLNRPDSRSLDSLDAYDNIVTGSLNCSCKFLILYKVQHFNLRKFRFFSQ